MKETILFIFGLSLLLSILVGIAIYMSTPDSRTVDQIKQDRYKDCILYASVTHVPKCKEIFN